MRHSLLVLVAIALVPVAGAKTYPAAPKGTFVSDGAKLLSPGDAQTIDRLSRAFLKDTGAPIVVATLPSLQSVGAKSLGIERYSTGLFDRWRIGRRDANGGILLVVAKEDRKARIELGRDWAHDYDAGAHRVMQGTILPAFKRGDYSGGIVRGCQELSTLAKAPRQEAMRLAQFAPSAPSPSDGEPARDFPEAPQGSAVGSSGPSLFGGGLLCLLVPVVLVVIVASALRRRRFNVSPYGSGYNRGPYVDGPMGDDGFLAGMVAGEMMSGPMVDPGPMIDNDPGFDMGVSSDGGFDSGSAPDSGGFDTSGSDSGGFDSGDSGGGGDSGSW